MERLKPKTETILTVLGTGLTLILLTAAFSKDVRKEIGARDKWTCQSCSKQFRDGYMVHAAHKSEHHSKSDPLYNTPEAGEILCIDCHQEQHEEGTSLGHHGDMAAVRLLQATDRHTRR
jgi:hypothetical protein